MNKIYNTKEIPKLAFEIHELFGIESLNHQMQTVRDIMIGMIDEQLRGLTEGIREDQMLSEYSNENKYLPFR